MPKVRKLSAEEVQRIESSIHHQQEQAEVEAQHDSSPDQRMLDQAYPHVADWVYGGGWIELGQNEYSRSFIRILDIGGMLWESTARYRSLDALLRDAEAALTRLEESGDM